MRVAYSVTYHAVHLHLLHGVVDLLVDGHADSNAIIASSPRSNSKLPVVFLPISNREAGTKEAIGPETKPSMLCFSSSSVTASIAPAISATTAAKLLPLFLTTGHRCPLPPAAARDLVRSLSLPIADVLSLSDLRSKDRPFEDRCALTDSHDLLSSLVPSNLPTNSAAPHHHRIPFPPPFVLP